MKNDFIEIIDNLYSIVLSAEDSICKKDKIKSCKNYLGISEKYSFAEYYNDICRREGVKGVVYTPKEIVSYMLENSIEDEDIINNPFLKILDPSCGAGNILVELVRYLENIYIRNLSEINAKNGLKIKEENILEHIVFNNIYGIDVDELSIKISLIEIYSISGMIKKENFYCTDFLMDQTIMSFRKFDVIIGNPPYIGRKAIDRNYSNLVKNNYKEIYSDKSDISYCFFKRALQICKAEYKISFIVSRYFLESLSGSNLRKYILDNSCIYKITDFYGTRPFKNIGIDPVVIFLSNKENKEIAVDKVTSESKTNESFRSAVTSFNIKLSTLSSAPWRIQPEYKLNILSKIEKKCDVSLKEVCNFYQGIITGCDKAFIIDTKIIDEYHIEKSLIRSWIKNSDIHRDYINDRGLFLIYADDITEEVKFPNAISYIEKYKEKLVKRRECLTNKRKWYELQWGRDENIFQIEKLIFPYKSNHNIFSKSSKHFFSADIYALIKKDTFDCDYDYLALLLNSPIYEFYFKCFGKKMGRDIYEYYPNNVERLQIPLIHHKDLKSQEDLFGYFELTEEERNIIYNSIK